MMKTELLPEFEYEEDDDWMYDHNFIMELLHIGTVEGGHLPELEDGLTREAIVAAARGDLVDRSTPRDGCFNDPKWVVDMFREMKDDQDFVATLANYCYECGWVGGADGFQGGFKLDHLAHPEGKSIFELVEAYLAKYRPAAC